MSTPPSNHWSPARRQFITSSEGVVIAAIGDHFETARVRPDAHVTRGRARVYAVDLVSVDSLRTSFS
jgi:hypothetical protein